MNVGNLHNFSRMVRIFVLVVNYLSHVLIRTVVYYYYFYYYCCCCCHYSYSSNAFLLVSFKEASDVIAK
jgi:hypothetical protein